MKIDIVTVASSIASSIPVRKGDKNIDPAALFGIWAAKPRTLENIRENSWKID